MSHAIKSLVEGETISHRTGAVTVVLACVKLDAAYRVSTLNGGFEIPELSNSYPTEAEARAVARELCGLFAGGQSVAAVLDDLTRSAHNGADRVPSRSGTFAAGVPVVLVERAALIRKTGPAGTIRITESQYRVLAACLAAGTDEIGRGDGEANVTTLRTLAQFGAVDLVVDRAGAVVGARVTGFGWRALAAETARRAGKPTPHLIPVPVAALASAGVPTRLRLVAA